MCHCGVQFKFLILSFKQRLVSWDNLLILNPQQNLADLQVPPSNKLEKLKGRMKEYYSIRINDQWRIVFKWDKGTAAEVEILDYH